MGPALLLRIPEQQDKVQNGAHRRWDHLRLARPSPWPPEFHALGRMMPLHSVRRGQNPVALSLQWIQYQPEVIRPVCWGRRRFGEDLPRLRRILLRLPTQQAVSPCCHLLLHCPPFHVRLRHVSAAQQ